MPDGLRPGHDRYMHFADRHKDFDITSLLFEVRTSTGFRSIRLVEEVHMFRVFSLLCLIYASIFASTASANFTCSNSCENQCAIQFVRDTVDPICYQACRSWFAIKCFDLQDPWASTMGEVGARSYPAAKEYMLQRNQFVRGMIVEHREILRPFFGTLVDSALIHYGSTLLNQIGEDPFAIVMGRIAGQTFGHDIFIDSNVSGFTDLEHTLLLAHELCHTAQYVSRGSSLQRFGRDYFEGFAKAGSMLRNSMELECEEKAAQVEATAAKYWRWYDSHRRNWTAKICNNSDFEDVSVAIGFPHKLRDGFSLVPMRISEGWYTVRKGQCISPAGVMLSDESLFAYAYVNIPGNYVDWGGKTGGDFCINPKDRFKISEHHICEADTHKAKFRELLNPWRNGGSGEAVWNLTGAASRLLVCNKTDSPIHATFLRNDNSPWRSDGVHVYSPGECRETNFGVTQGPVFIYGESKCDQFCTAWSGVDTPEMCVHKTLTFNHPVGATCPTWQGAKIVSGMEQRLAPGLQTFNFEN